MVRKFLLLLWTEKEKISILFDSQQKFEIGLQNGKHPNSPL